MLINGNMSFSSYYAYGLTTNYAHTWSAPTSAGTITLPSRFSFSCASTRNLQTSPSTMIKGIAANQAAVQWNPLLNTYTLMHEPSKTNYFINSETISVYSNSNITINGIFNNNVGFITATGITDPAGDATGVSINSSAGNGLIPGSGGGNIGSAVLSMWTKPVGSGNNACISVESFPSGSTLFGASKLQLIDPSQTGTDWKRVSSSSITAASNDYFAISDYSANSSYAGIQYENGIYSTSYISTSGASVTRATSILSYSPTTTGSNSLKTRLDLYPQTLVVGVYQPAFLYWQYRQTPSPAFSSISINPTTKAFSYSIGGSTTAGTFALNYTFGDKITIVLSILNKSVKLSAYKNNVYVGTDNLTVANNMLILGSNQVYICSNNTGTLTSHSNGNLTYIGMTA